MCFILMFYCHLQNSMGPTRGLVRICTFFGSLQITFENVVLNFLRICSHDFDYTGDLDSFHAVFTKFESSWFSTEEIFYQFIVYFDVRNLQFVVSITGVLFYLIKQLFYTLLHYARIIFSS